MASQVNFTKTFKEKQTLSCSNYSQRNILKGLIQLFPKIQEKGSVPRSFYEVSINLIPKSDKYTSVRDSKIMLSTDSQSCSESMYSSRFFPTIPGQVPSQTLPTVLTIGNILPVPPLSSAH